MRARADIADQLIELGIIAVIRVANTEQVLPICEALVAGGVLALEIPFTVPDAPKAIRDVCGRFGDRALVGAGSVLNVATCRAALEAGAEYIVSPITKTDLVTAAHAAGKPVMLGAYTPTEAQTAHEAGADFIKIFPADKLGPAYIRNIRAPLPHLRIVPTGGVDLQTAPDFLKAGCAALGVGSSLITKDIVQTNNWAELTRLASEYARVVREARAK